MNVKTIISNALNNKQDFLYIGLSFIFFLLCILHITLIALGIHIEQMWMAFGSIAMILLLLSNQKSIASMFAIVVFGTYVADEEFLLEVTAISAGEQLNAIRESRSFERLTVNNEQQTNAELSNTLKTLLNTEQSPEKIIAKLEEHRDLLEIESDIPGLETVDKQTIKVFSQIGGVHESQFFNIMRQQGFNHDEAQDSFEKLGAADYLKNRDNNISIAQLTPKGLKLAQKLAIPHTQL